MLHCFCHNTNNFLGKENTKRKKTKFKNHIESQVTYDLEDDFDNTNESDLGQKFSHGDTTAVVVENLNPGNRRTNRSKQEMVLDNTSLTMEIAGRLERSTAEVFSGNGKGLSCKDSKKKFISGNGSGANSRQEHTGMNQPGKGLSYDENKQKLMSENRSGANSPQEHPLMNRSVAWDESNNKSSDQIMSEKESPEVKRHEKTYNIL